MDVNDYYQFLNSFAEPLFEAAEYLTTLSMTELFGLGIDPEKLAAWLQAVNSFGEVYTAQAATMDELNIDR